MEDYTKPLSAIAWQETETACRHVGEKRVMVTGS